MSDAAPENQEQEIPHQPGIASVLSSDRVVINIGETDGVKIGQRFLVYEVTDEEIKDPFTQEPLGLLEEPKGTGEIVSVQERIAVLQSDREPSVGPRVPLSVLTDFLTTGAMAPFINPVVGDRVKRIY